MKSSETSRVFIRRRKNTVHVDRYMGGFRDNHALVEFESLLWGISFSFPLARHFYLPDSEYIFNISQDLPICVSASLSQDGFQ